MTAEEMRELARAALTQAGALGFVRCLPVGDSALLVTDAAALCEDAAARARLLEALGRCFAVQPRGRLLALTPRDGLLLRTDASARPPLTWDWEGELAPAYALADRLLRMPDGGALSPRGRLLLTDAAKLLRLPRAQALAGLGALRANAAVLQRMGDAAGLRACGCALLFWCEREGASA